MTDQATFVPKSKHVGRGRDSDSCPACQELIAESKRRQAEGESATRYYTATLSAPKWRNL